MEKEVAWALVLMPDSARRMALFRLLEWSGHRATVADTIEAALQMLDAEPFDIVLMDASLAEPDGRKVLRKARSSQDRPCLPLLVVGQEGEDDFVGEWIGRGAADGLIEPLLPIVALATINRILERE